jgi:RNA polymerase sigma-70 factor (ECF subfamily)
VGRGDSSVPSAGTPPPDDVVVAGLRAGDEAMFALVVDTWSAGMLRAARAYVSGDETAEDVVQDTWLAVIRGIDRFEARSSLRTWVYRILINIAKTRGVKDSRTVPLSSLAPTDEDSGPTVDPARFRGPDDPYPGHWKVFPAPWPSAESDLLSREALATIQDAVAALPARQRLVITLRDVEGYDSDEVCALLDITAANQRVLLHRARVAVRLRLEDYFAGEVPAAART